MTNDLRLIEKMSAIIVTKNTELMQRVIEEIKTCFDPEIPVDVWELSWLQSCEPMLFSNINAKVNLNLIKVPMPCNEFV